MNLNLRKDNPIKHDILKTTFKEHRFIENFHITFEVDFMGKKARDLSGPR